MVYQKETFERINVAALYDKMYHIVQLNFYFVLEALH